MKLRNKKTGEIGEPRVEYQEIYIVTENNITHCYKTLLGMLEEWEDYKEPKEYWFMDYGGRIKTMNDADDEEDVARKEIGNYFETKEEAEKAVEKLKAWKRLKDKGFRFNCWYGGSKDISFSIPQEIIDKPTAKDLDLLFGGEE